MADDDRSAKAARAKALLKKRQQRKVESADHPADISSPRLSPTRDILPAATSSISEFGVLASNNDLDAITHESAIHDDANASIWRASPTSAPEQSNSLRTELEIESRTGLPASHGSIVEKDRELHSSREAKDGTNRTIPDFDQLQHMQEVPYREQRVNQNEALESSLKNEQSRANELELKLSRLQDTHSKFEAEHEKIKSELFLQQQSYDELLRKDDDLHQQHHAMQQQLASAKSDIQSMTDEKSTLREDLLSSQTSTSQMRIELSRIQSELDSNSQSLNYTESALAIAVKRAEQAERALQNESKIILQTLEEMRPNISELNVTKFDLNEELGGLRTQLKNRRDIVAELANALSQLQISIENFTLQLQESDKMEDRTESPYEEIAPELQQRLTETQGKIQSTAASLNEFRNETISYKQTIQQQKGEFSDLVLAVREQLDELNAVQNRLDLQRTDRKKNQESLREAQRELESLRAELSSKDSEILQLRNAESNELSHASALTEEMINAMKQQHDLEISSARTQIRNLESSLFEAEGKHHAMQNRISTLQDEADRLRKNIHPRQSLDEINQRPQNFLSVQEQHSKRTSFDENLPPKIRHQRQVSLSMLKVRLHSEVEVAAAREKTFLSSGRARSPLANDIIEEDSITEAGHDNPIIRRFHALDETHVFWCSSCKGDLIVL